MEGQLVLQVRRLIELFIMIDAEGISALADRGARPGNLRRKEASGDGRHHYERREVVKVGHIDTQREARDLRIVPVDGEGDGSIAQDAEIEGIVGVFPDVIPTENQILSESLLDAGVKFVAKARLQRAETPGEQLSNGDSTTLMQPWLESTRFSLKGDSRVRA